MVKSLKKNASTKPESKVNRFFGYLITICGGFGLLGAFVLTLEKIELLKNPNYIPTCNVNPVLSCGSIIGSDQASAFSFPNPIMGLIGFSVVITIGVALISGIKFKNWFMNGLLFVSFLAVIFVHWLIYQSLYNIGSLCPYCMVVWTVTIPIFWYTLIYNIRNKHIEISGVLGKLANFASRHHFDILITWYLIIILLILNRFWYYWSTIL